MKKLVLLLTAFMIGSGSLLAQTDKKERARLREQRRMEQAAMDSAFYAQSVQAIQSKQYVLEADRVIFKRGSTAFVSSNTNFVAVDGDRATVQIAFNVPVSGANGIGGITVEGNISNYEEKVDKRGTTRVKFNVMGTGISAQIDFTLPKGGTKATVNVTPNFHSNRMSLEGQIVPLEASSIFKGRAL